MIDILKRTTLRFALVTTLGAPFILMSVSAKADSKTDYLAMSGAELYGHLCASCHGKDAHGDGPAAGSFKVAVPDLTRITRRHGGVFPGEQIEKIIDGRYVIGAHGTRAMPIWGEEFMHKELGNPDADRATERTVTKLVEYLRSIQKPTASSPKR